MPAGRWCRSFWSARVLVAIATVPGISLAQAKGPPPTRRVPVIDTIHGVVLTDPYRWLESQGSQDVRDWIAQQNASTESVLGPASGASASAARLGELLGGPAIGAPRRGGGWDYFTLRRPGEEAAAIWRRPAPPTPAPIDPNGTYERIVDPLALRSDGTTSVSIEGVSPDGALLLYSVRDGGPDEISVRVRDVARGTDLADSLPWALYASLAFDQQAAGFYYVHRSRETGPRFKYHRLGTAVASDRVLFGFGLAPTAFLSGSVVGNGKWFLFTVQHGWARNDVVLREIETGRTVEIARGIPAHFSAQFIEDRLWMRTDLDAPRGRLVKVDPAHPAPADWEVVIPEGEDVLDGFSVLDGRLVVTYIHDVAHRVRMYALTGAPLGEIAVPAHSSVSVRSGGPGALLLTATSFTLPSITWKVDLATGERSVWEGVQVPFDSSAIEVRQVWYRSTDGTRAPMYVMYRKGLVRNGMSRALLTGYGGFALSLLPRFDARAAFWVEQGGVFAQATLRGGNEYGETWHRAGMLTGKQQVFDDFLAAAQSLVDSGYTSPDRFAIRGTSNGGLLMGSAVTQRPDLFRAAFIGNPDLDILRFPWFPTHNNAPALLEYGDARDPVEFAAIRRFSPVQNVRSGTPYPAMLISTGHLDTRVPPWAARKFAAEVQRASTSGLPVLLSYDWRQGHAGGRSNSGAVAAAAQEMEFLLRMTGPADPKR